MKKYRLQYKGDLNIIVIGEYETRETAVMVKRVLAETTSVHFWVNLEIEEIEEVITND